MELHEYAELDGLALAALVRAGDVEATELVELAIRAIERVDPQLNAVVHRMYERARQQASSPQEGPFTGVPMVVKDSDGAVAGEPYTMSCRFMEGYIADHDAEIIARQRRSGAIFVAKTNLPELAIMGTTEPELRGATLNPWNTAFSVGGSSGGSAALVAAGAVPIGHAGDGGGSIRIPASACGLFGLKPTRGRNPIGPDLGEGWGGYVQMHLVSRSVRDSAAMLDATHGPEAGAPYADPPVERPFLEEVGRPPGKLRIAFTTASLFGRTTHPDSVAAVQDAARLLEDLGHTVEEARPTFDRDALVRAYLTQVAAATAAVVDECARLTGRKPDPSRFEPATWFLNQLGRTLSALDLQRAREDAFLTHRALAPFFEKYDLFLTSTMAHPPPRIGELALKRHERLGLAVLRRVPVAAAMRKLLDDLADESLEKTGNTMLFNQTGQPAISVPLYWNSDDLPIGVQLAGRFAEEGLLLRVAAQLEEARPWNRRRPRIWAGS